MTGFFHYFDCDGFFHYFDCDGFFVFTDSIVTVFFFHYFDCDGYFRATSHDLMVLEFPVTGFLVKHLKRNQGLPRPDVAKL